MSHKGVAAGRALVQDALAVLSRLTPQEWAAPSACRGWNVQDVITHLGHFFQTIADPGLALPDNPSGKAERLNDLAVAERRHWSQEEALAYYEKQASAALPVLAALQEPPAADAPMAMAELGTYPMSALADAVAFDHLVHLGLDLAAPTGPLPWPGPSMDELRLAPALDWMTTGLPQMCAAALGPWGVSISDITVRATGEDMIL